MSDEKEYKGPPENVDPGTLWAAITATPLPHRVVDFPRKHPITKQPIGQLAIVVLRQDEAMACTSAADAFAKKNLKIASKKDETERGYNDLYNNEAVVQILIRACREVSDIKKPVFKTAADLRSQLTSDEISVLYRLYMQVQTELGPYVVEMSAEEIDAWVEKLALGASMFPLAELTSDALENLAMSMARRLHSLQTGKSSPGEGPDDSLNDLILPSDA